MFQRRAADERGRTQIDWLQSWHTFSFGEYRDPRHDRFRSLRVMNEDIISGGGGFGMHPHRDMEIVTYVLSGRLAHRDSLGNGSVIEPGRLQRMTAGAGILHSEENPSPNEPVHLYQIWLFPEERGLTPGYEERTVNPPLGSFAPIATRDGREGSLTIHQHADLLVARLAGGESARHDLRPGRAAWLQVMRGQVTAGGEPLVAGDGLAVTDETTLEVNALEDAEVMLFDLA